ncbi:MAG: DEAD/DEAH box helicase family protein [Ignavibacteria bacterium]|nr:DEAD/DEAH box helicase family protein [Ignavibacteria bacterium]
MNEAETRAELIDPLLAKCGWGVNEDSKIFREKTAYKITDGKIQTGGTRGKSLTADYVLAYKGIKLAVIEAKSADKEVGEGVAQAKQYAELLQVGFAYAANGKKIYQICMKTGKEKLVNKYPAPDELWNKTFKVQNDWREKFASVPYEDKSGTWKLRYYQEIAIRNALEAIANNKTRILLTLATGTGKTAIAFQIAWKLYHTRWNLKHNGERRPRILFLADRNILADQAYNAFSAFPEDALVRIKPGEIKKKGSVPTNGNIFFTIFQTFMSGTDERGLPAPYFGEYPEDYFDFIIIDECHRGGANDESNWRAIMDYFSPAVQLGLTATPRRTENVDTYRYFGEPVYVYSLKEGINDGFLTPFKLKRIKTSLDDYKYSNDDEVLQGTVDEEKVYTEAEFNRIIEIKERESKRVKIYLDDANQKEKALVFCKTQAHAALIRDLINRQKESSDTNYCVRVTSNDGEIGEQYLREFQDNEKTIPTILTTSHKLSTGVDARNIRNIVLLRQINSMIEFKQIIGRGTRLFDNKEFFTIYDYVDAYHHFNDPAWDGEPICEKCGLVPCECKEKEPPQPCPVCEQRPCICEKEPPEPCPVCGEYPCICKKPEKLKIKLADGKEREIKHFITTIFMTPDGKSITAKEFIKLMYGQMPEFFTNEEELREIWSNPATRKAFLVRLDEAGYGKEILENLQKLFDAEKSDIFDVLEYVSFAVQPITREKRVELAHTRIYEGLDTKHKEFLDFVLSKYIETGVEELDDEKLPVILKNKYYSLTDGIETLGGTEKTRKLFIEFQKHLYEQGVA